MDTVSEILKILGLESEIYLHSRFCGVWGLESLNQRSASFHLVARGGCWLHQKDQPPMELSHGDLIVLPFNPPHHISYSAGDVDPGQLGDDPDIAGLPTTTLICGKFTLDQRGQHWLLQALPPVLLIRAESTLSQGGLYTIAQLITHELELARPGAQSIVNRLADVLFVHVIRQLVESSQINHGVLAALLDSQLGRALSEFHANPGKSWTLESLAAAAAMSRTGFSQQFSHKAGITPMQYATQWRMQLARDKLLRTQMPMADIAESVGYYSEAAFNRAFKKVMGETPGKLRRQHRT